MPVITPKKSNTMKHMPDFYKSIEHLPNKDAIQSRRKMSDDPIPERSCSAKRVEKKKSSLVKSIKADSLKGQIEEAKSDKTVSDESDDEMAESR